MAKQYIDVLIDGKVYSLGGRETEGYVQQIATYLNGKIFQLKAQPGFLKMPEDYRMIILKKKRVRRHWHPTKRAWKKRHTV